MSLVLGAKPEEVRTWHAFPNRNSLASAMDWRTFLSLSLHWMFQELEVDWPPARCQRRPYRPFDHRSQRYSMGALIMK